MWKYLLASCLASSLVAAEAAPSLQRNLPLFEEEKTSRTFFSGEFLYWLPEMDGLKYVQERIFPDGQPEPGKSGYQLSPREIKGEWQPGFRIGAGRIFDEKGWDASFTWTHFNNTPSASFSGLGTPMILPAAPKRDPRVFVIENPEKYKPLTNFARGSWRLIQNVADLEVGKRLVVGDSFLARPFFGLRDAIFHNKTVFRYSYNEQTPIAGVSKIATKSSYWGLGPRAGGSASYEFGYGLGIFALGSASFLFGHFDSTFNGVFDDNPTISLASTLQIETGLQWKKIFKNKTRAALQFAWEQNFYNNVNPSLTHLEKTQQGKETVPLYQDQGDLLMKGWTASCQFDY
jgi:hypothetical protein